jgi:hypothetical protein
MLFSFESVEDDVADSLLTDCGNKANNNNNNN